MKNSVVLTTLVLVCAFSCLTADATSLLSQHSANGPFAIADITRAGFYGAATDDTVAGTTGFGTLPLTWPSVIEGEQIIAFTTIGRRPDVGAGTVNGGTGTFLTFGGPLGSVDTLEFYTSVAISALSAEDATGDEQDATFQVSGSLEFYIDTLFGGASPGDYVGDFHLDRAAVRTAVPLEPGVTTSLNISIFETIAEPPPAMPPSLLASTDGTTEMDIALYAGRAYRFEYMFGITVPHGIDPDVEVRVIGTFTPTTPIPEPATSVLIGVGVLALAARNRRRKSA